MALVPERAVQVGHAVTRGQTAPVVTLACTALVVGFARRATIVSTSLAVGAVRYGLAPSGNWIAASFRARPTALAVRIVSALLAALVDAELAGPAVLVGPTVGVLRLAAGGDEKRKAHQTAAHAGSLQQPPAS